MDNKNNTPDFTLEDIMAEFGSETPEQDESQEQAGAEAPDGWTKWVVPGFEFIRVECDRENVFGETIAYLQAENIPLMGAVHDFTCPETGRNYMLFPIRKL